MADIKCIAEIACVPQVMSSSDGGSVGCSERWKKRVAVYKADSVIANPVHRRRVGGIHRSSAQAIEDEDHDIARHAADWLCLFRKES